jgi:hypothetical protein
MRAHTVSAPIEDNISAIDSPQRCCSAVTAGALTPQTLAWH